MAHYCDTVGIDLGTTRSCVAVWDGTQVHVIANESGQSSVHACVCLHECACMHIADNICCV